MHLSVVRKIEDIKRALSSIDMTEGTPWKKILLFAIPLLVGNVFQQLFSTVDAIMLGYYVGDNALAAVGASMPIFFLIMVLMMGISVGAGVMVSQYFGAKKRDDLSYTIGTAIVLSTILGGIMMVFGPMITRSLLVFLDTPYEILEDSIIYMNILLWGVLGMGYFNMLSGVLRGVGDAFSPLVYLAFASILNIALNFMFIGLFGWGVMGAAIGTVIAQALTSVLCLFKLMKMRDVFDMGIKYLKPKKQYMWQVLKLGVPTGASQAVFAIAMMIIQPLANSFGPMFLAANVIVMRVDGFVMMPIFSFGNAMTVFAGQNMGAGKIERVIKANKQGIILILITALTMVGVILLFGRNIAGLFSNTPDVLDMAVHFLSILAIGYVIFSVSNIMWGTIRGAGDAVTPLWGAMINTVLLRLPSAYLFVWLIGEPVALIYSLLLGWTGNTILSLVAYRIGKWRTKSIVKQKSENVPDTIET